MRVLLLMVGTAVAGCGQTGSLYLPDESVESPVEIRTAPPQTPPKDEEKKDDEPAEPPGG
jgi:predicted small lipoprotein YifL